MRLPLQLVQRFVAAVATARNVYLKQPKLALQSALQSSDKVLNCKCQRQAWQVGRERRGRQLGRERKKERRIETGTNRQPGMDAVSMRNFNYASLWQQLRLGVCHRLRLRLRLFSLPSLSSSTWTRVQFELSWSKSPVVGSLQAASVCGVWWQQQFKSSKCQARHTLHPVRGGREDVKQLREYFDWCMKFKCVLNWNMNGRNGKCRNAWPSFEQLLQKRSKVCYKRTTNCRRVEK